MAAEGYRTATYGTSLGFEGLASADFDTVPIKVAASARDWGNPDSSNHLRPFLAMGYNPSTGYYNVYDGTNQLAASVVVLAEEVRDMNLVSGNSVNSYAFYRAIFKGGVVNEYAAVTWSSNQRISIRDNA